MRLLVAAMLLASVSGLALAPSASAQASQDTLSEAVASAIGNNPQLMAQRSTRAVADEQLAQARAGTLPTLNFTGSYGTQDLTIGRTFNTPAGTFPLDGKQDKAQVGLEARQSIWSGGTLSAKKKQAQAGVTAAEA